MWLENRPCAGPSILIEVKPPTGEPDAGDPPVRFGGGRDRTQSVLPTPIRISPIRAHEPIWLRSVQELCRPHLIRDVKFLTTLPDACDRASGERLREASRQLFAVIHRREQLSASVFQSQLEAARTEVLQCGTRDLPETRQWQPGESVLRTDLDDDRDLRPARPFGVSYLEAVVAAWFDGPEAPSLLSGGSEGAAESGRVLRCKVRWGRDVLKAARRRRHPRREQRIGLRKVDDRERSLLGESMVAHWLECPYAHRAQYKRCYDTGERLRRL